MMLVPHMQLLATIDAFVPILHSLFWCVVWLAVFLFFRKRLSAIVDVIEQRLKSGGSLKVGDVELGEAFVTKTSDVKGKVELFGNPDRFQLLIKAKGDGWSNSTKAMQVPGGCVVQTTNEHKLADGSWTAAEALAFVPNVVVIDEPDGKGRYLAALKGDTA